ncbi:uracil-DNA glycosylase [Treponema sp.]|uniref:uracil-DNA glycosylase n=1 Tax=Treponema sp. TaxID=166 RepID=UPI00298E2C0C|nr:uracil-DNA glycosylase [Treponema sp.]
MCYYIDMTAEEKKNIYNLLKTVSASINGYNQKQFDIPEPVFTDDRIPEADKIQAESQTTGSQEVKKSVTIENLAEKIGKCERCQLFKTRTNVVPGTGVKNPLVLVIGEGPGEEEDKQGLPFVGKAGQLLDKMLAAISLSRTQNCYIANVVKCRPPHNRDPLPEEISACISFLDAQINLLKPSMILLMGRVAAQTVLRTSSGINSLRGNFSVYNGIPVMPTYHPSALLRDEKLKAPAWQDLKAFRTKLLQLAPDYEKNFIK